MEISVAITTHNRPTLTIESFRNILNHENVKEIVIVDDASEQDQFEKLQSNISALESGKIKIFRNDKNKGMLLNKAEAVSMCSSEWVALIDSDNVINNNYINALNFFMSKQSKKWDKDTIYMPDFAIPQFDFRKFRDLFFNKYNVLTYIEDRDFRVLLNCCNYVVNRESYLETFINDPSIKESDTIYFAYLWMKDYKHFQVVPGMNYEHRVHENSGWLKNADYNMKKGDEIIGLIKRIAV